MVQINLNGVIFFNNIYRIRMNDITGYNSTSDNSNKNDVINRSFIIHSSASEGLTSANFKLKIDFEGSGIEWIGDLISQSGYNF